MSATNPKLLQRLLVVMQQCEYIKRDTVPLAGSGVYRDKLVAEVRPKLLANGIVVYTSQIPGSGRYIEPSAKALEKNANLVIYCGTYVTRFANADDSSDYIDISHEAQANDFGDKAPGKAATYAEKMNILHGLFLETGIADEGRNPGEGDGIDVAVGVSAPSTIKAPVAKAPDKPADKPAEEQATKEEIAALKSSAVAKGVDAKIVLNLTAKGMSWEAMTKKACVAFQKFVDGAKAKA